MCPQCRTPREGGAPFCEGCRWNFLTNTATSYTPAAPRPPQPRFQPPSSTYGGGDGYEYQGSRPSQMNRPAEPIPSFGSEPSGPTPFAPDRTPPAPGPAGPEGQSPFPPGNRRPPAPPQGFGQGPGGPGSGGPGGPGSGGPGTGAGGASGPGAFPGQGPGPGGFPGQRPGGPGGPAGPGGPGGPGAGRPAGPPSGFGGGPGQGPGGGAPSGQPGFGGGPGQGPGSGGPSGPSGFGGAPGQNPGNPSRPGGPSGPGGPGGPGQDTGGQGGGYGYPHPGATQAPPGPGGPGGRPGGPGGPGGFPQAPQQAQAPQAPQAPQVPHQSHGQGQGAQPGTWTATIGPDREYFMAMMQRSGPEAAGLNLPAYSPEQQRTLTGNQVTIGRRRHSTGDTPDIDLSVPPEDPGVSHQHAMLVQQPDGSWAVVDQNSTNGTTVNMSEEPIQPFVPVPLQDGDRVHVGAWTTITVRRG
ncbi:FHA domain-containing protein [Streptomyces sp. UMAF16]|nr:FHA domain-containing protein [Streptomyces sp. UMAF16]